MNKNRFEKHLTIILKEMCKRVGVKFDDIDFDDPEWYMKHSWTTKEMDDFIQWLADYLYNNTEARKEVMRIPKRTKKDTKKVAQFFVFDYGWKQK